MSDMDIVSTEQNLEQKGSAYAGFWIRVCAVILDSLLFYLPFYLLFGMISPGAGQTPQTLDGMGSFFSFQELLPTLFWILLVAAFNASKWQATPGKRILNIHIMTRSGGRMSYPHALGRNLAQYLSAIPLGLGYVMAAFMKEKTALHDLVAGTRVIYGRPQN